MLCYFMVDHFRVKNLTKKTEKMASGVLSGVVKVSGFFTSSIVNSKVGKKFFSLLPGEIVLASLDGFSKFFLLINFILFVMILMIILSARMPIPYLLLLCISIRISIIVF